ncbi:hypothetical protein FN846DRAFT_779611 [Sphaerosporella brunnea]|uniref:threonine--tRNA ligase n=1 Tax=Sphaerosporella brunnea TaxID=1250544 RepID=A0A5J5EV53_9PEZI|nr:hypothetical protein FN846DRAFT_779611 [Sphaerosporella brunnea]
MRLSLYSRLLRRSIRPSSTTFRPLSRHVPGQIRSCGSCAPADPAPPVSSKEPGLSAANLQPDHRTIATAQQLLTNSIYSPGSPLFLPHGTRIYNKLVEFLRSQYALHGFQEVLSPNIYKRTLWETSGHWENYKEDMFEVTGRGAEGVKDGGVVGGQEEYGLKPMNCPGHCLMFKATGGGRSLRGLPVRYADFSPLHRNENSGSLSGLTRVRRFHQDDGHIFCRPIQIAQEISSTLQFIETAYRVFHLPTPELVLSTRPDNYIGDLEEWNRAEAALKQVLDASGQPWTLNEGDGAFYGPKIDIMIEDSDGKKHQTATVQLDFQLPRRFGLEYTAPAPASEQKGIISEDPVELSESGPVTPHYNGRWPFWLSPRQAIVIPVAMTDEVVSYAQAAQETISGVVEKDKNRPLPMSKRTFHVDIDLSTNSLSKKIRAAKTSKYNHILVVGERDVRAGTVSVNTAPVPSYVKQVEGAAVKTKPVEMTPAEVYKHFVELEDRYA